MTVTLFIFSLILGTQCFESYTVKQDETLSEISVNHGVSDHGQLLYILNSRFENPNRIYTDDIVYIPCNFSDYTLDDVVYISTSNINDDYLFWLSRKEINTIVRVNRLILHSSNYFDFDLPSLPNFERRRYLIEITAKEKFKREPEVDIGIEIDGLIYDETVTKSGYDFYRLFYNKWKEPSNAKNYSITIMERPGPGLGTIIEVKLNDITVYKNRIKPSYAEIDALSSQAIQYTIYYINNHQYSVEIY